MFDMLEEIAAIRRSVARDDDAGTVSVSVARTYQADIEDVWDAVTNPERITRWLYPISGDFKPGGSFQLEGNAGGEILRCDRPTGLQVTFGGAESVLDLRATDTGEHTTIELTHTVPLAMAGGGAGALFVGPGWDDALFGLAIYLRGEAVLDQREAANSPEMVSFNTGSIRQWAEAIEISGTATADEIAGAREAAAAHFTPGA